MIATALLISALAALAVWIILPLLGRKPSPPLPQETSRLEEIKHASYRSIIDLEFDRRMGKVSEDDYRMLRSEHEAEAAKALHSMDQLRGQASALDEQELSDQIEAEIAAARRRIRR